MALPRTKHHTAGRISILVSLALSILLSLGCVLSAQSTGEIVGHISDRSGAAFPGATVVVTNPSTGYMRPLESNTFGDYAIYGLTPATYAVEVAKTGFAKNVQYVTVSAGDRKRADAQLDIEPKVETTVVSDVPVTTVLSNVAAVITAEELQDLPMLMRNPILAVALVAGAHLPDSINCLACGVRPDYRGQTSSVSLNAQDDILNNHLVDGADNNERVIGTTAVKLPLNAIRETLVQSNNYAPEVGRTPGAVINIVTKSGSNQYHGGVFEFLKNDVFNARDPFNPKPTTARPISPKSELRQNDFGGDLGGPVNRNKTFFFFAYERFSQVIGVSPMFSSVPTAEEQRLGPQGIVDSDPFTKGLPVDPIAAKIFSLYPAPNVGTPDARSNNFVFIPNRTQQSDSLNSRVDHHFENGDLLYLRYTLNNVSTTIPDSMPRVSVGGVSISPGSGGYGFSGPARNKGHNVQINYRHFSSRSMFELKTAFTRLNNLSNSPNAGTNAGSVVGFPANVNYGQASTGLPLIEIAGLQSLGDSRFVPLQDLNNTYQYSGSMSYLAGRHDRKFGFGVIRRQVHMMQSANPNGSIGFFLPGDMNPLAAFLVGAFTGEGRSNSLVAPDYRTWEIGGYAQDAWTPTNWLTINYGARYDTFTPFTEAHDRIANFDLATYRLLVAGVNGVSKTAGIATDFGNFAPRVGFAATSKQRRLVLRGGVGISYFPGNYTSNASLRNAPFTSVYAPNCASPLAVQLENAETSAGKIQRTQVQRVCAALDGQPTTLGGQTGGLPIPVPQSIDSPNLSLQAVQLDLKSGSVKQFNVILEKVFGKNLATVGYVGSIGRHLPVVLNDINVPDPTGLSPEAIRTLPRPTAHRLPNLGSIGLLESAGASSYHALQVSLERQYAPGVIVHGNYTWSHAIDDTATLSNEGQEGYGNANPFRIKDVESGNSDLDIRHRLVFGVNYELPLSEGHRPVLRRMFGGWQINSVLVWSSGSPFSITDNFTGSPNNVFAAGVGATPTRPYQIAEPTLVGSSRVDLQACKLEYSIVSPK